MMVIPLPLCHPLQDFNVMFFEVATAMMPWPLLGYSRCCCNKIMWLSYIMSQVPQASLCLGLHLGLRAGLGRKRCQVWKDLIFVVLLECFLIRSPRVHARIYLPRGIHILLVPVKIKRNHNEIDLIQGRIKPAAKFTIFLYT